MNTPSVRAAAQTPSKRRQPQNATQQPSGSGSSSSSGHSQIDAFGAAPTGGVARVEVPRSLANALRGELKATVELLPAPGGAMAVRLPNGRIWAGADGTADVAFDQKVTPRTLFKMWSISKTFTAAIILRLVD